MSFSVPTYPDALYKEPVPSRRWELMRQTIDENKTVRAWLYSEMNKDREFAEHVIAKCREPVDGREFFFNAFMWAFDPFPPTWPGRKFKREGEEFLPFILYRWQSKALLWIDDCMEVGRDGLAEKPRDVGFTYLFTGDALYRWLFNEAIQIILGSRKFDYVDKKGRKDTLFQKIRDSLYRTPPQLLPPQFDHFNHDQLGLLINPNTEGAIIGEHMSPDFAASGRYTYILMDEFARWREAREALVSSGAAGPRFLVSTPRGPNTIYSQIAQNRYSDKLDFRKFVVDWKDDPRKDEEWYEETIPRYSESEFAQEVLRSHEGSAGDRYFNEYDPRRNLLRGLQVIRGTEIVIGVDFGKLHPAFVLGQDDELEDRFMVFWAIKGFNINLREIASWLFRSLRIMWPFCPVVCCVDPSGNSSSDIHKDTQITVLKEVMREYNYEPRVVRNPAANQEKQKHAETVRARLREGRLVLAEDAVDLSQLERLPRFVVESEGVDYLERGFNGGLHFAEKNPKEIYHKDGYYDHVGDALVYIASVMWKSGVIRDVHRHEAVDYILEHNAAARDGLRGNVVSMSDRRIRRHIESSKPYRLREGI